MNGKGELKLLQFIRKDSKHVAWAFLLQTALFLLVTGAVGITAFNIGTVAYPSPTKGMHEVNCNDIVRMYNVDTKQYQLVCEINMKAEDDNVKIFRGEGAYGD